MIYGRKIIILLSRHWHLFRKYWLDGEKLSFLLCGTIHPSWALHTEMYCIWSKWQAENVDSDLEETVNSPMSSPSSAFSTALSHAKCPFEAQAVQLQIKKIRPVLALALRASASDAIHSCPFCTASGLSQTHSQDRASPHWQIFCHRASSLPSSCPSPAVGLSHPSRDALPPPPCSITRRPPTAPSIPRSQTKPKLYQPSLICLTTQGQAPPLALKHLVINLLPFIVSGLV